MTACAYCEKKIPPANGAVLIFKAIPGQEPEVFDFCNLECTQNYLNGLCKSQLTPAGVAREDEAMTSEPRSLPELEKQLLREHDRDDHPAIATCFEHVEALLRRTVQDYHNDAEDVLRKITLCNRELVSQRLRYQAKAIEDLLGTTTKEEEAK